MMEWLRKNPQAILITFSHDEERRLVHLNPDLKDRILDWRSFRARNRGAYTQRELAIDNSEMILQELFDLPIVRMSMTYDEEPESHDPLQKGKNVS